MYLQCSLFLCIIPLIQYCTNYHNKLFPFPEFPQSSVLWSLAFAIPICFAAFLHARLNDLVYLNKPVSTCASSFFWSIWASFILHGPDRQSPPPTATTCLAISGSTQSRVNAAAAVTSNRWYASSRPGGLIRRKETNATEARAFARCNRPSGRRASSPINAATCSMSHTLSPADFFTLLKSFLTLSSSSIIVAHILDLDSWFCAAAANSRVCAQLVLSTRWFNAGISKSAKGSRYGRPRALVHGAVICTTRAVASVFSFSEEDSAPRRSVRISGPPSRAKYSIAVAELHALARARSEIATRSLGVRPGVTRHVKRAFMPEHRAMLLPARGSDNPRAVRAARAPLATLLSSHGASSRPRTIFWK